MTDAPQSAIAATAPTPQEIFLPNFCDIRIVFSVIIIAELLAFILTLASASSATDNWTHLALLSLFVQWIALFWSATLCSLRKWLAPKGNNVAGLISYVTILLTTALFSELAYWGSQKLGEGRLAIGTSHLEFLGNNLGISAIMGFVVLRYFYLRYQLKLNIEAETQARIQALQARIRPHFLFNSLNAIVGLIRHQPRVAEEAVEDLADLFRTNLDNRRSAVPFTEELAIARRYLHMESLRLGERLKVEWELEKMPEDAVLPALTLQPLLENAIYHGIENLAQGGTIHCKGYRKRHTIYLSVSNPVTAQKPQSGRSGNQLALDNIRQRLLAHFDNEGRITINSRPDSHEVILRFPYITLEDYESTNC